MASCEITGEWEHKSHLQSFTAKRKLLLHVCPYLLLLLHKPRATIWKDSKETSLLNSWGSDWGRTEQRNQGRLPRLYLWRDRPTGPKWNGSPCTSRATALPPPYLLFINGICPLPSAALSQHEPIVPAERALQAKFKWPISVSMYFKAAFPACQGWVSNL